MTGIGKIWARRVYAGTQNPADCPVLYRQDMLDELKSTEVYKDVLMKCLLHDISTNTFNSRTEARNEVGRLFSAKEITESDLNILVVEIDKVYGTL